MTPRPSHRCLSLERPNDRSTAVGSPLDRSPSSNKRAARLRRGWWRTPRTTSRECQTPLHLHHPNESGDRRSSHGVGYPTTLIEASSDLHRVYLSRLCCAFRLSQPLDASFRSQPLQPCFMPVTPLGFRFQRVSLPGSGPRLSARPSLLAVYEWSTCGIRQEDTH